MFFIKKISTIFLVLIIFISSSNSDEQIVYLDLDNVVTNTKAGKSILSKLEKSKKSTLLEFEKKEKDLRKIEEEIKKQKKQDGNYFDSFIGLDFFYDKRNQKYQTTSGFFSNYDISIPILSENNTLTNNYNYKIFKELYENNVSTFAFSLRGASSLSGDNIKLSERLYIPGRKLRGFESGKIGPKDGSDFIGGNYVSTINATTTIPKILENVQSVHIVVFADAANIWGVDYDSSLDKSGIRSSVGVGLDWLTPVGPLTFSFSEAITKASTDVTESFRFQLGTTF